MHCNEIQVKIGNGKWSYFCSKYFLNLKTNKVMLLSALLERSFLKMIWIAALREVFCI